MHQNAVVDFAMDTMVGRKASCVEVIQKANELAESWELKCKVVLCGK